MMGRSMGTVIFQNCCDLFAPSIDAASYSGVGISCKAARNMSMKVGAVVKMFWNMIAIQVTLGPRRYQNADGMSPPKAWAMSWNRPRGLLSHSTAVHSAPNPAHNWVRK